MSNSPENVPAISVRGVTHTFKGGHTALDDVNLTCGVGVFGLLGPNGAGKSTLMRILCTLLEPRVGEVRICGLDVVRQRAEVRPLLGFLPQDFGAWRLHRVEEVVDTLAQLSGMHDKASRRARVTEVIDEVGLAEVRDRKVKKLSGGMVRRLGVAQALVHRPRILIVDEPTVGLDPEERIRFRNLMAALGKDRTVLLSTHIVADLGGACREIALLDRGQIIFQGAPSALVKAAAGKVFEVAASESTLETLERDYEIVSSTVVDGQVRLRGIAGNRPLPTGATAVSEPSLEESYVAFMTGRGQPSASILDMEEA
jgi:ABC-2 type transport system ATP-binding protein